MKRYLAIAIVLLVLVALTAACNPIWEAPPIERLRASPTAAISVTPVSEDTTR